MQAFSVKLKFHVFCCKTSILFCAYLHCDGHCLYFYSLFIISCLFSAKSFTYCSYSLYNFSRGMVYNKITAREQKPRCKPPQTSNYSQHINLSLTSITQFVTSTERPSQRCGGFSVGRAHRSGGGPAPHGAARQIAKGRPHCRYLIQVRYTASAACTAMMAGTPQRNKLCSVLW